MRRLSVFALLLGALAVAVPAGAGQATPPPTVPVPSQQTPPPPGRPYVAVPQEPTLPPRAPALPTLTANIKLDLIITDTYTGTPVKKTVSMLILNGSNGMIRTSNTIAGARVGLNVDAATTIHQGGLISVRITFEYTPAQVSMLAGNAGTREQMEALRAEQVEKGLSPRSQPAELHESLSVVLQDGKTLLVSQSADPTTDRKVTVEVMATILK